MFGFWAEAEKKMAGLSANNYGGFHGTVINCCQKYKW